MTSNTKPAVSGGGFSQGADGAHDVSTLYDTTSHSHAQTARQSMRAVIEPLLQTARRLYEQTGDERHAEIEAGFLALWFVGGEVNL